MKHERDDPVGQSKITVFLAFIISFWVATDDLRIFATVCRATARIGAMVSDFVQVMTTSCKV